MATAQLDIRDELKAKLSDQHWRLNHLYWILDKDARRVKFVMNEAQESLWHELWYRNVILKARQLGFTTFIALLALDTALFRRDFRAGFIAHKLEDASALFREKIIYPYENLPTDLRLERPATKQTESVIEFGNNSSIRVGTSMRSGTVQYLHVSEMGKIAAATPEKAKEIRSGAFEAVPKDGLIFVESTAEGREGVFFDMCEAARKAQQERRELSTLDFKFHFRAWWQNPEYVMPAGSAIITDRFIRYFHKLAGLGIELTPGQKAWYVLKEKTLQNEMKREHPSTPDEAFEASIEGAYFSKVMATLRQEGRITDVPYEPLLPCYTFWDLGFDDSMSIWVYQPDRRSGRLIDYIEGHGEGFEYYAEELGNRDYRYLGHYMPHDISVGELGTGKKREQVCRELGIRPLHKVPRPKNNAEVMAGIQATRVFLRRCWIDRTKCAPGIRGLDNYRQAWDEKLGKFKDTPRKNDASHPADALRTGATGYKPAQGRVPDTAEGVSAR